MSRSLRFKLIALFIVLGSFTVIPVGFSTAADASCKGENDPNPVLGTAFTHEVVGVQNTCDDDGEYRGRLKDIAVGNGHCAIVQIDTGGWWGGRKDYWNCRDNAWNNYTHWDGDHRADMRLCESRNGGGVQNCSDWIVNKEF